MLPSTLIYFLIYVHILKKTLIVICSDRCFLYKSFKYIIKIIRIKKPLYNRVTLIYVWEV